MRALGVGLGLLVLVVARPALADPRLDEIVYAPYIENHMLELETRYGGEVGRGDLTGANTTVVELEAGLDDRLSLALLTVVAREPGVSRRLTGVGLEGIYYVGQIPKLGVDVGAYLEYRKGFGEPDGVRPSCCSPRPPAASRVSST